MKSFGNIANDGQIRAVASGAISSGKPVVVNADGTVSSVSQTAASLGTEGAFNALNSTHITTVFDSSNNKHIIVYRTSSNLRYVVATVASDGAVTFGTDAVVFSGDHDSIASVFDSTNNRVVTIFRNGNDSSHGYAMVGSLSGTTVTWGSATEFNNNNSGQLGISFDSTVGKVVISYRNYGNSSYGTAIVGTVSGTSISFGTPVVFNSGTTGNSRSVHDSTNNKTVLFWADGEDGSAKGDAVVGTISGTDISFGSTTRFEAGAISHSGIAFDSDTGKVVIAYRQNHETDGATDFKRGTAVVGTVSGTSISFGSAVAFDNTGDYGESSHGNVIYDTNAKKVLVVYPRTVSGSYSNRGYVFPLKVSGTTVVADTPTEFTAGAATSYTAISFDSNVNKNLIVFKDNGNSEYGTAVSFAPLSGNITAENYIGMSRGVVDNVSQVIGSNTVFEAANSSHISSTYDANASKVVVAYKDSGNSSYGTAIVGTVSGNSISFGSAVVFESADSEYNSVSFDSSNNKVVIAYRDRGNSNYGTAIVGTVSGTSISFGTPVVFESADSIYISSVFDSDSNKVVIAYTDNGNSGRGTAIVGTVSGTSISFGSANVFNGGSSGTAFNSSSFDTSNNKVVIAYSDNNNSQHGSAIVGTVSGTSISFGSEVVFEAAVSQHIGSTFDSSNNKVVIVYSDEGNSSYGTAIVGTVSGTSISFGTAVVYETGTATNNSATFDTSSNKVAIAYADDSNSGSGTFITGTVSGTSITFDTSAVFETGGVQSTTSVFDSAENKVVIAYRDNGNSSHGTSVVIQVGSTTRAEVASGQAASMDITGSVSDNQIGLTAGQTLYVQTDGTLSETADDPSVTAGTAISATELIVKG